ncbi:hypothetical protein O181_033241 [Austropuccinia psidii MF-1]|uniref:Uncharacterized protein n=1 Tax=Austropuccinia psidii MF-1 TaxID=1389203 RepID=A0A9Q3H6X0_9BASI|nr:hypothetical protein [Austropuccinia psidii MF-1]
MGPKGSYRGLTSGLKPQSGPPGPKMVSQFLRARNPKGAQNCHNWPLNQQLKSCPLAPVTFKKVPPQDQGALDPAQWNQACRKQDWCIYGIIYHYATFFLRNPMVILLGPHFTISNQFPD